MGKLRDKIKARKASRNSTVAVKSSRANTKALSTLQANENAALIAKLKAIHDAGKITSQAPVPLQNAVQQESVVKQAANSGVMGPVATVAYDEDEYLADDENMELDEDSLAEVEELAEEADEAAPKKDNKMMLIIVVVIIVVAIYFLTKKSK